LTEAERTAIAEKLVESLVSPIEPEIERAHLQVVEDRRAAFHAGVVRLVEGEDGLAQVLAALPRMKKAG
jgi:hypothetical protein